MYAHVFDCVTVKIYIFISVCVWNNLRLAYWCLRYLCIPTANQPHPEEDQAVSGAPLAKHGMSSSVISFMNSRSW